MNKTNLKTDNTDNERSNIKTIDLVMTGMLTAIICIMAPISLQIEAIPFTLGLFAIFLIGALLSPRYALLSVIVYILIGVCGLPVFSNYKSGPQVLIGATGGYLMSYPLMTLITSLSYKYIKKYKIPALACGMVISLVLCYLLGTLWFIHITNNSFYSALFLCVIPYIPFDLLKIVLAISISMVIRKTTCKSLSM